MRVFFLFLLMLIGAVKDALATPVYSLGYFHLPPLIYHRSHQAPTGIIPDVIYALLTRNNMRFSYTEFSTKRFYLHVMRGDQAQIQIMVKGNADIDKYLVYGKERIFSATLSLYWQGETHALQGLEDLKGKSLILIRGYHYSGLLPRLESLGIVPHLAETTANAKRMLSARRAPYLLDYHFGSLAQVQGLETLTLSTQHFYISAHQSVSGAQALITQFDRDITALKNQGVILDILAKYR